MHFAINYAVNKKWIADFDAARAGVTATKKAPECRGFMQLQAITNEGFAADNRSAALRFFSKSNTQQYTVNFSFVLG